MFLYKSICYSSLRHAKDALLSDQPFEFLILTDDTNLAGGGNVNFTGISYGVNDLGVYQSLPVSIDFHFPSCEYLEPEFTDTSLIGFEMTRAEGATIAGMMVTLIMISWGIGRAIDVIRHN